MPPASADTPRVSFFVFSSTSGSPPRTASPSRLCHWPTVAAIRDSPRGGTRMSIAMLHSGEDRDPAGRQVRVDLAKRGADQRGLFCIVGVVGSHRRAGSRGAPDVAEQD